MAGRRFDRQAARVAETTPDIEVGASLWRCDPEQIELTWLPIDGAAVAVLSFPVPEHVTVETLSNAESDIVEQLVAGRSYAAIAARRGTSARTVGNQIAALFRKLKVGSRRELVAFSGVAVTSANAPLRTAVLAADRARASIRRSGSREALEIWCGLVSGPRSPMEVFDQDGRRFFIARHTGPDKAAPRTLTAREKQVAGYAALGHSNKQIAYDLGLSPSTVRVLLARAKRKLSSAAPCGDAEHVLA
jgi:DNA-binding CsgD family transcriptional regulator